MALVLDPRLCQRVLWIQICPSVRPSVRRSVYKAFFFRIGSLLFSGFHALDFWDIEPDDRNKKSSKSDNFGFLRKILVISKVGEIGHFGTQNQHTWAFLLFFSLNRLWSCTWSYTLLIWPNCWVFVYELSGSGFESSCSHLLAVADELFDCVWPFWEISLRRLKLLMIPKLIHQRKRHPYCENMAIICS